MKFFYPVLLILSTLFLTGCISTSYYAEYKMYMAQVERPIKAVQLYGDPHIDNLLNDTKYKFFFEDSLVKILWLTDSKQILFSVENKTNQTIKIPWDDAAYVDGNGLSHRVIHSSIDFNDKERPQPPSVIVRKGRLEDSIIPSDYIKWVETGGEHSTSYWDVEPFIPDNVNNKGSKEEVYSTLVNFISAVKSNIHKEFQVLLPLQVHDTVYEYIFTFGIEDVKVNKK